MDDDTRKIFTLQHKVHLHFQDIKALFIKNKIFYVH